MRLFLRLLLMTDSFPLPTELLHRLDVAVATSLQSYAIEHVVLGLSGGLDSMLLLQLLTRWRQADPHRRVQAVYVHHGLSEFADQWALFCQAQCAAFAVEFRIGKVQLDARTNIEAQARHARYQLLQNYLTTAHCALLTAHHADDQLESLLLALKRGAGPAGLSGIAAAKPCGPGWLLRPLLGFERAELEVAALGFSLRWINDDSNQDQRFERNFLRHSVLPLLTARWPKLATTAARSMSQLHQVQQINDSLLQQQLQAISTATELALDPLSQSPLLVQDLLLRLWLRQAGLNPSSARLQTIRSQLIAARTDACPQVNLNGWQLRRFARRLYLLDPAEVAAVVSQPQRQRLIAGQWVPLADGRMLRWQVSRPDMSATSELACWPLPVSVTADVELGFALLSVAFKPAHQQQHKALKQWCKLWQVPPWQRGSMPLIIAGQQILLVVGRAAAALPEQAQSWIVLASQALATSLTGVSSSSD